MSSKLQFNILSNTILKWSHLHSNINLYEQANHIRGSAQILLFLSGPQIVFYQF
jgi:hypothetical protein